MKDEAQLPTPMMATRTLSLNDGPGGGARPPLLDEWPRITVTVVRATKT